MQKIVRLAFACALFSLSSTSVNAQSWKDIFNSPAIKDVIGTVTDKVVPLSKAQIASTWHYVSFASRLEGDDLLATAGGVAASSQIDTKLNEVFGKVGVSAENLKFTFTDGDDFSSVIMGRTLNGTYTLDAETKEIVLSYNLTEKLKGLKLTGQISWAGDTLFIYFNADKLLDLLIKAADLTQIEYLVTISNLAKNYDGLMLGFELAR